MITSGDVFLSIQICKPQVVATYLLIDGLLAIGRDAILRVLVLSVL